jgi:transcription elongation factor Elf1
MVAIRITNHIDDTSQDYVYQVACGNIPCSERREFRYQVKKENIDVYNQFVDDFARAGA